MATAAPPAASSHANPLAEVVDRALQWTRIGSGETHHTCDRGRRHLAPHPGRCIACWLGRADKALSEAARLAR